MSRSPATCLLWTALDKNYPDLSSCYTIPHTQVVTPSRSLQRETPASGYSGEKSWSQLEILSFYKQHL